MTFFRVGVAGLETVQASGRLTSLVVATVPEPGAILLVGSGLLGLIGIRIVHRGNVINRS